MNLLNRSTHKMKIRPRSDIVCYTLLFIAKFHLLNLISFNHRNQASIIRRIVSISKDHEYVFKKIAKYSKPLSQHLITTSSDCAIYSVICHSIVDHYILAIKSFFLTSNISLKVVAHDDGSLTEKDKKRLQKELPNIQVLEFSYTTTLMKRVLKPYPVLLKYRLAKRPNKINIITTVDIPYFAKTEKILYLDGDILFFKRPSSIIRWIKKNQNTQELLYMKDYVNAYVLSEKRCFTNFGKGYLRKLNMGIFCYWKRTFNLNEVNTYFSILHKLKKDLIMVRDQTYLMIHAQKYYPRHRSLSDKYIVSFAKPRTSQTVAFHYTSEIRNKIYTDGIELLFQLKLL